MSIDDLTDEDRAAMTDALNAWKANGEENPLIPMYDDADGDDVADFYGLDADGNLVVVSGATIEQSVAVHDGGALVDDAAATQSSQGVDDPEPDADTVVVDEGVDDPDDEPETTGQVDDGDPEPDADTEIEDEAS